MTNAQLVTGAGGAAAGSITQIGGNITLPAGGPWMIHGLWSQAVMDTAVHSEGMNGNLIVNALSGDLNPDPAPGKYPSANMPSKTGANFSIQSQPLNIYPVNWLASGKAVISLSYENMSGNATAPIIAAGIIFGDGVPDKAPLVFSDSVNASLTAAAEASIGSITLAEKATRIVGMCAIAMKDGAVTADEGMLAHIRLDSADVKFSPSQYPCQYAFNAADGTPAGGSAIGKNEFIPLDIPVIGGSIINVFGTLVNAVTAGLHVSVFIAYE